MSELRVPTTLVRHEESLLELCRYSRCTREALLSDADLAGRAVKAYIEFLWEDGESCTGASYALAALQYFAPNVKGQVEESWKLTSLWGRQGRPTEP